MLGFLNATAWGGLLFLGLEQTQAINASIILATMTINIVLISWLFFAVRISARQISGIVIGFLGIMTIVVRGEPSTLLSLTFGIGDPLLWAGALCFALYSTNLKRAPGALTPSELMTVLCAVGVITSLPLLALETAVFDRHADWTLDAVLAVVFIALFPSLIAQILWVGGISRVGANTAGYFIYTVPVFGALMAIALLGETMRWYHYASVVLVFIGVYMATTRAAPSDARVAQTD